MTLGICPKLQFQTIYKSHKGDKAIPTHCPRWLSSNPSWQQASQTCHFFTNWNQPSLSKKSTSRSYSSHFPLHFISSSLRWRAATERLPELQSHLRSGKTIAKSLFRLSPQNIDKRQWIAVALAIAACSFCCTLSHHLHDRNSTSWLCLLLQAP